MSGSDTTDNIARMHELHGLQPVLPVADVSASAPFFEEVLGFEVEFLHGAGSSRTRGVKSGDGSYGQPILIHLSHAKPEHILPSGELRSSSRAFLLHYVYSGQEQQHSVFRQSIHQA